MDERGLGSLIGRDVRRSREVSSIAFVVMAQSEYIDDVTIIENADLFNEWDENWTGRVGDIVKDEGSLYRKINADFNTPFPQSKPSADKSQWKLIGDPLEEYPEWVQPIGSHDAYMDGAKVTHNDKRWLNTHGDGNIWEPGVFGWDEVI